MSHLTERLASRAKAILRAYTYLVDVLQRVENHPAREVHLLTPRLWKQHFAQHLLRSHIDATRQ